MITETELKDLLEQLPFYVNGTASPALKERIEAALPASDALRLALDEERQLQSRVLSGAGELLEESEPHFEQREAAVMAAISTPDQPDVPTKKASFASALSFLNPRRWNPALALTLALAVPAQAAVIASQTATIASLERENFALASGPCADRDRSGGIVLELKDDAPWKSVVELLDGEALIIVENGAFGILTVRGEKKGAERSALINELKQSPLVTSAEPEA